jgi:O-antigen/teichoic acid export membrane protein
MIATLGVVSSLVINFILIPELGALGAAWACLVTQGIAFVLQLILVVRTFGFRFWHFGFPIVLPLVLLVAASRFTVSSDWMLNSAFLTGIGAILTLVALAADFSGLKLLLATKFKKG